MFRSKLIRNIKNISHGFFNNQGGYSKGIYKSLNCGIGSRDKKINVKKNLKKVCKIVGCSVNSLILLKQIHSNKVHIINKNPNGKIEGDALITNKKKIALGILSADCAPVFIYDPENKFIGAIHTGWKGAYKKIITKTINILKNRGCKPKNLITVVGPCISKKNYEVKNDFFKRFLKQSKNNKRFFFIKKKRKFFSLNEYIMAELIKNGIKNIEIIKKDTFLNKNKFFSARRSIKNNYDDYGRNISIIMIK